MGKPRLSFLEWTQDWKLVHQVHVNTAGLNYAHDFLASPSWYVCHITPFVSMSDETLGQVLEGLTSPGESMRYYPERPCQIVLVERQPKGTPRVILLPTEPCHIYHFGTCHESADGRTLSFSAVTLGERFTMEWQHKLWLSNSSEEPGILHNFKVDLSGEPSLKRTVADPCSCEFPVIHPYRHVSVGNASEAPRYTYLMAAADGLRAPYTAVVKHDARGLSRDVWNAPGVVGEPCFVPRLGRSSATSGAEDDGWIIVQVYDHNNHTTDFAILDAQRLKSGPVCLLHLGHHLPYAFHGTFTPNTFVHPPAKVSSPRRSQAKL